MGKIADRITGWGLAAALTASLYGVGSCTINRFREYQARPYAEISLAQFMDDQFSNNKVRIKAQMVGADADCGFLDNTLDLRFAAADGREYKTTKYNGRMCESYKSVARQVNAHRGQPVIIQTELTLDGLENMVLEFEGEQIRP